MLNAKFSVKQYHMRKQYDFGLETARTRTKFDSFKNKFIKLWNNFDDRLKFYDCNPCVCV